MTEVVIPAFGPILYRAQSGLGLNDIDGARTSVRVGLPGCGATRLSKADLEGSVSKTVVPRRGNALWMSRSEGTHNAPGLISMSLVGPQGDVEASLLCQSGVRPAVRFEALIGLLTATVACLHRQFDHRSPRPRPAR